MNFSKDLHRKTVRPAAVAGFFYPQDSAELQHTINQLLAQVVADSTIPQPKALIAPHAGYIYSGLTAAIAYSSLLPHRDRISRVVLLGPAHRVYLKGLALSSASHFSTPLGLIEIDQAAVATIKSMPQVISSDQAHQKEHSLEVHLPFLQCLLDEFTLIPLVVGDVGPEEVAAVLELLWGGDETVIIISSDLSHYHEYAAAREIDAVTTHAIEHLQLEIIGHHQACGCMPVKGLLHIARQKHLQVKTLDVRNSGDTAGSRDRVVGYGAYAFLSA